MVGVNVQHDNFSNKIGSIDTQEKQESGGVEQK